MKMDAAAREPLLPKPGAAPIEEAGWLSRSCFLWLNPVLNLGYKRTLEDEDMPPAAQEDAASVAYENFTSSSSTSASLFRAMAKCYWRPLAVNGMFALLKCVAVSGGPLLLKTFVNITGAASSSSYGGLRYILVATLLLAKIVESQSQRQWIFGSKRVGMRVRSGLMAALYAKQLRLASSSGPSRPTQGEVLSYMAVDAYRVGELGYWVHLTWSIPLQILFAFGILVHSVGLLPSIAGVSVIAASMLVNRPMARMQRKFQDGLMRAQDDRLRAAAAALRNIKIIKLQAWEEHFRKDIERLRSIELSWLSKVQFRKTYNAFLFWLLPTLVSTSTFVTCWAVSLPLDAGTIFTTIATLRILQEPVRQVPDLIAAIVQAKVSESRIAKFLREEEFSEKAVERLNTLPKEGVVIELRTATLSWDPSELPSKATLRNINVNIMQGSKVAVCGEVGSGKSTLLCSILGEVPKLSGTIRTYGTFAYAPQTPWIQSGTVRDNILFGLQFVEARYAMALKVCALDKDLESFPSGDLTEIGERGLNLSGGQKQRVQLARAVYQDADVYLLDDPFSAVDAETGATLIKSCVHEALATKTVVLVTHQVDFLPGFDNILVLRRGEILHAGRHEDLLLDKNTYAQLVSAHGDSIPDMQMAGGRKKNVMGRELSNSVPRDEVVLQPTTLTKQEERGSGEAGVTAYIDYLKQAHGFFYYGLSVMSYMVFVAGQMSANWWMASRVGDTGPGKLIAVYSTIGLVTGSFVFFRSVLIVLMGLAASKSFFSDMMNSLLSAPMAFFDSTPSGRILSRASADLSIIDLDIPFSFAFSFSAFLNAVTNVAMTTSVMWQILVLAVPLMYMNRKLQVYYLSSARELMRINGASKAPILNLFGESIAGTTIIRAFGKEQQFMERNLHLIDLNSTPFFYNFAAREWLILRVEMMWSFLLCFSALVMVILPPGQIAPGFVGMVLSYGLSLNNSQIGSVQNQCNLANMIISVERLKQYTRLPMELLFGEGAPPQRWPSEGKVEFRNLQVRYRADAPLVLHDVTCTIDPGQKVGIVGRTGSGKTTLISTLFRLVDPAAGKILIDGVNITGVGLVELRSRLCIIPQEPTLFRGSVRFNLDPLSKFSDEQIWEALEKCRLADTIRAKPSLLDSYVGDDGENWSIGERQLFCLGRVLLKKSKLLVLDEATASIDNATDRVLQRVLREEFGCCTTLTVAHRIPTVIDGDMVMTLENGRLIEFDEPAKLLKRGQASLFCRFVAEYLGSNAA